MSPFFLFAVNDKKGLKKKPDSLNVGSKYTQRRSAFLLRFDGLYIKEEEN